ncbi:MAG TPA: lysophospholipid acyltransferase family protein [Spirochaetia bacterium]|nr:lysophospholipid acyltransferase family protein [Spirochaetales bacterium]HRY81344.1 lysophospholipid acyltransferase family protein [Spirochaetia bacterium]
MTPPASPPGRRRFGPPWPESPGRRSTVSPGPAACLRGLLRLASGAVFLAGLWVFAASVEAAADPGTRDKRMRLLRMRGARYLSSLLGVIRVRRGRPSEGTFLAAGNHISWLDSLVVVAETGAAYTAYSRDSRLVDSFLRVMGTILLPRGYAASLPGAVKAAAERLRAGCPVGVFPEGTTTFGPGCLPFKPAFFQAALDTGVPVQPFALTYETPVPWPSAPRSVHWVDWTPLPLHVFRVLCLPRIEARVAWLPAILPEAGEDRRGLASRTEAAVRVGLAAGAA